jgi:AcrR family transcriptional regulator
MPLYKRLPHGPHRLGRDEVISHQRSRIHGAMVEAVAQNGYQGTSVKQVIGLAGVSRRSFYEQFANKEECFLATFDMLTGQGVKQMSHAYRASAGGVEERLRAALHQFVHTAITHRNATVLVVVEAQTVGTPGLMRLRRATGTCEQMLARCFSESREVSALPVPVVRAIAGGLHGTVEGRLRERRLAATPELGEEMLRWMFVFEDPAAETMTERMSARLARSMREAAAPKPPAPLADADERERLLQNSLRLAVLDDYRLVTVPQIAEEAEVSIDTFFELFTDKEDCFLAALDKLAEELVAIAADPDLVTSEWSSAVPRVMRELMRYLADHPLYAQTIAREAFAAGSQAVERNLELAKSIATLLTEGAPCDAKSELAVEGVAGAIWHMVRCQVAAERIQLLPALSDYLSYIVLAPYIGAEAAVETVTAERD